MKIKILNGKKAFILFGYAIGICSLIVLTLTFFSAYFNKFQILVTVNSFSEAHIEAVLLPLCLLVSIVGFYYHFISLNHEVKQ